MEKEIEIPLDLEVMLSPPQNASLKTMLDTIK
jgi:hypothetical protein